MSKLAFVFCLITLLAAAEHQLAKFSAKWRLPSPVESTPLAEDSLSGEALSLAIADSEPFGGDEDRATISSGNGMPTPALSHPGAPIPTGLQDEDSWAPGSPMQIINQ